MAPLYPPPIRGYWQHYHDDRRGRILSLAQPRSYLGLATNGKALSRQPPPPRPLAHQSTPSSRLNYIAMRRCRTVLSFQVDFWHGLGFVLCEGGGGAHWCLVGGIPGPKC